MQKKALICGAGGFIGGHLVNRLKEEGYSVRGVDLKENEYANNNADEFIIGDLRDPKLVEDIITGDLDEIYQLAADMGGAGFVFTGENDAAIMHNSALINLNVLEEVKKKNIKKIFYSSSACMYPEYNQLDPDNPKCSEDSAYPAAPDSEYGWEKLFSERLYLTYHRNHGIEVRVARFHNIFGPQGTWDGGREKAPAAVCRKVALASEGGEIEIWGDGKQTRSFLIVHECISYLAPMYDKKLVEDEALLKLIEEKKPKYILINIGGGTQEKLGAYLKKHLSYTPAIICTGAAIAFLTGQQANIPIWGDKMFLGWLFRCIQNPKLYVPRYFKAFLLATYMFRYGAQQPL